MKDGDFLREYTELIKATVQAQANVSHAIDAALSQLASERKKYEAFNTSSAFLRYWKFLQPVIIPVLTVLVLGLCAFLFVSTGHSISVKAGDYQIQAK